MVLLFIVGMRNIGREKMSNKTMQKNLLITGKPRTGKTTLVVNVIRRLDLPFCGFYTSELLKNGNRVGFVINNLRGERGIFAYVDSESDIRVSRYGVELDVLEAVGVSEVERCSRDHEPKIIVIDEIGKMELFSEPFKQSVLRSLNSPFPVLATVMGRGDEWVAENVLSREDIKLFMINVNNRKQIEDKIVRILPGIFREIEQNLKVI